MKKSFSSDPLFFAELWVQEWIIKYNLCPFAKKSFQLLECSYHFITDCDEEIIQEDIFHFLDSKNHLNPNHYLLLLPKLKMSFPLFYDLSLAIQASKRLKKNWQIVAFHPKFQFGDAPKNSRLHYVNRSPFPILHVIPHPLVEKAAATLPYPEYVSEQNEKKLQKIPDAEWKKIKLFL